MLEAIKPLLDSGIINEDVGVAINEAWESKLNEAREQVRAELREEYARKYEHDKNVMVEALDKMVTAGLQAEIVEFKEERDAMNSDRVAAQKKLRESVKKFDDFMIARLAHEIKELREDRAAQLKNQNKLEQFVVENLAKEIKEFDQDKRAVVEAKVKLVSEAKAQLETLKRKFVSESAKKLNAQITSHLKGEIVQLKEDIKLARENQFGRRILEAFAAEFSTTFLNEKAETKKLLKKLEEKDTQLSESVKELTMTRRLVENKDREVRILKESNQREKILNELLETLNEEKATVMKNLLESVQTPKLRAAFDKYLPAVINSTNTKLTKQVIKESIITGNKSAIKTEVDAEDRDNVIELKRLAGL